jgi:hypothetical protein
LSNDRKSLAEKWMRDYAARVPVDYDELLSRAAMYVKHGTYWCDEMRFISEILPAEFWTYYEMITDQDVPESKRGDFYSCSC